MGMGVGQTSQNLNSAGAVNPATLDPVGRLCRVCGAPNAVIFRLKEKPELVGRIGRVLNLSIDLEADAAGGFPGVICRKCCNLVETFFHYKKSVAEGQDSLKKQVQEYKDKKAAIEEFKKKEAAEAAAETARLQAEAVEREQLLASRNSPESIGVDPLDSILPDQGSSSILPDASQPDTKVGNIKIKQESLKNLVASSSAVTAPMTAVFTDAVPDLKIKIEPGLIVVKKEKVELGEKKEAVEKKGEVVADVETPEENNTGELFSQLVGEVNKLNEKGEEKTKDLSTPEEVADVIESEDKITKEKLSTCEEKEKQNESQDDNEINNSLDGEDDDDGMTLAISNVTTQLDAEDSGIKSVTEVLDDISETLEVVTKQIVSKQSEVKEKEASEKEVEEKAVSESESKKEGEDSSKIIPKLPAGISVTNSTAKDLPETSTDASSEEKQSSSTVDKAKDADSDVESAKESSAKKGGDDKLFSDIDVGEDPWSNAFDKSKDPVASGSWIPDGKGMEDLENAPGMEVRDLRQRSDFFYDEDYYNAGGQGEGGDLVPGADDPLMEMDDDDTTGDNDDFGGYDPLKLVQMTGGELNDLDFEMEDFDEDITMEDHDIMEDKDDHTEDGVDHEKDIDLTEEIREVSHEESKRDYKESEVIDRENDLDISDESGLSDSRDGLNKDFDQGGDELNEDNYNLDNDVDPPEKDTKTPDSKSKKTDNFSKSKNGGTVENTLDDSKEDDTVTLDANVSSENVMGDSNDFTDHLAGEENLNEDCDDDLKDDDKSDCNYQHQQEDHNFESERSKTDNFDGTSDDKDCINDDLDHQSDDKSPSSVRKSVEDNHNVLSEDVSTDNFENGPSTENVDDINDFNAADEADFEFQIEQVQSIQDSSQAEDSTGPEPGSNCDNSA
eukprot:GFUD01002464.1.p1 GENE.GFUD01002464.1~~GFUD01002464.1.p1  ORF type:complete len:950 (+),score=370.39 GFUD01002464.1:155-2851(+)